MDLKQKKLKNSFNIWRIIFTCVILLFHLFDATTIYNDYPMISYHWYIAVEFFFILSGFLMAQHIETNQYETVFTYIKKRIIRLYPEYIIAFLVMACIRAYSTGLNIFKIIIPNWLEVFMLQSIGTNVFPYVNNPAWYVSALMLSSYLIYYLMKKHREVFLNILGPCFVVIIFGYMYRKYERLEIFYYTDGIFMNTAILRAVMGLTIGVLSYNVSGKLNRYISMMHDILRCIFEGVCLAGPIIFALFNEEGSYDFGFIATFAIGIILASSDELLSKISSCKCIVFFSNLSYSAFLSHFAAIFVLSRITNLADIWHWWYIIEYFIIVVIISLLYSFVAKTFVTAAKRKMRLRKLM